MARTWQTVSPEEAKHHPLYGIAGWLALFAFLPILGLLKELGMLSGEAQKVGMSIGQLFALDQPANTYMKFALTVEALIVAVIYWLLFTKHPRFRFATSILLLGSWPVLALIGISNSFPGLGNSLATTFFQWLGSCAIWVTYLQRSKRVRVTFEHTVLAEESFVREERASPATTSQASQHHELSAGPVHASHDSPHQNKLVNSDLKGELGSHVLAVVDEERIYTDIAQELDIGIADKGLWTRLFAECEGDEKKTKVFYIKQRADKLISAERSRLEEVARQQADEAAKMNVLEEKQSQRAYSAIQRGTCPNCNAVIPLESRSCPMCSASIVKGAIWHTLSPSEGDSETTENESATRARPLRVDPPKGKSYGVLVFLLAIVLSISVVIFFSGTKGTQPNYVKTSPADSAIKPVVAVNGKPKAANKPDAMAGKLMPWEMNWDYTPANATKANTMPTPSNTATDDRMAELEFIGRGDWQFVSGDSAADFLVFVHKKTIENGPTAKGWFLYNYSDGSTKQRGSRKTLVYFRCKERTSTVMHVIDYSMRYGNGDVVKSADLTKNATYSRIVPGAVGESMFELMCTDSKNAPPQ